MFYLVYWAHSKELGLDYIGSKVCKTMKEFEKYKTSSTVKEFRETVSSKEVVSSHESKREMLKAEVALQLAFDVVKSPNFANRAIFSENFVQLDEHYCF